MFETDEFKKQLADRVSGEAYRANLEKYENPIVEYLRLLAVTNEAKLMAEEMQKPKGRRGVPEALQSVGVLIQEASRYAVADNRKLLKLSDVERAYQVKFCGVWPFCK